MLKAILNLIHNNIFVNDIPHVQKNKTLFRMINREGRRLTISDKKLLASSLRDGSLKILLESSLRYRTLKISPVAVFSEEPAGARLLLI